MKSFALFVAFMVLLNTVGGVFAYTYTESFAGVSGPSEWTNLSRGFDVDYVSGGSVNYSASEIIGSFVINNETHTAYREFVVNSSMVAADQNDFPMMFVINLPSGVNTSGSNVRITDGSDNPRPREIENYNETSDDLALFFTGNISSTVDTVFRVYYGNIGLSEPAADSEFGSQAVWDDYYQLVAHLNNDPNGDAVHSIKDSTSNANHGTPYGLMTSSDLIKSDYGMGIELDGVNDYIDFGNIGYFSSGFSILTWATKRSIVDKNSWSKGTASNDIEFMSGIGYVDESYAYVYDVQKDLLRTEQVGSISWVSGKYYSRLFNWDGGTTDASLTQYVDDSEISHTHTGSGVFGTLDNTGGPFLLGTDKYIWNRYYDGTFDEIRISNITRSVIYRTIEYKNLNNPTSSGIDPFYKSINTEQTHPGNIQITQRPQSGINGTTINLTETNTSAVSTLNLGGLTILQNIENLFNNSATVDYANYTINYSTAHAVLRSPVNASSFYGSATLEWWTNPQGTSATYYVAEDPDFFTSVAQGTTTQENTTLALSPDTYYWKVKVGALESDVWQFTVNDTPPVAGLFNFSVYDESTFAALSSFDVKIYNDTWYNEKSTSTGSLVFNSSEVVAGEYTALINASGYSPRWRIVESPANVSAYLPNTTKQIWLINFNLIDYTNLFSYSTSRLILTKTTADHGTITASDSYFDASGSNPVYLIDYNNYILTLRNSAGYEKSVGSYLPIQNTQTSLVVGEITTLPDTQAYGGFTWNITKSNASIVLMWNAPEGSLTEAFQYNVTNSTSGAVEYEINTIAPYGTATFFIPAGSDTVYLIQLSASTSDGSVYHKESYRVSQQMIDLELSDYWYNVYSMFLLLILGLLFGYRNARTGAVIVSLSAVALAVMGLLHVPASVLAMAVTISIFAKLAERKK